MSIHWRVILAICLLFGPILLVQAVLAWRLHASLADCDAVVMDDECHYWNEIATYRTVGLQGGYFVDGERTAPAKWTHFGPHGPAFPMLVGSLARVFGWGTASGMLFNVLALLAGIVVWLALVRPQVRQLAVVVFLLTSFWPLLMYLPATLQEALHCAIAFVLAGLAHRTINDARPYGSWFWLFAIVVALASLLRITWVLVLIPWTLIAIRGTNWRTKTVAVCSVLAIFAAVVVIWQRICSPYPNFLAAVFGVARDSPLAQIQLLFDHARFSFVEFFSFHDTTLEVLQRYEVAGLIAISAVLVARPSGEPTRLRLAAVATAIGIALVLVHCEVEAGLLVTVAGLFIVRHQPRPYVAVLASAGLTAVLYYLNVDRLLNILLHSFLLMALRLALTIALLWMHRDLVNRLFARVEKLFRLNDDERPLLFAGMNLALLLVAVVTFYDVQDWRDYRVIAPLLLLCLLVMASGPASRWVIRIAVLNLVFTPAFLFQFEKWHRIRVDKERTRTVVIDLRSDLVYEPGAGSPWTNTILVPEVDSSNRVRVPDGIGVSWVVPFGGGGRSSLPVDSPYYVAIQQIGEDWLELPPKSRYVFASAAKVATWKGCHLQALKELPTGSLYLNLDSSPDQK